MISRPFAFRSGKLIYPLIVFLFTLKLLWTEPGYSDGFSSASISVPDKHTEVLSDTLPHKEYLRLQDSLSRANQPVEEKKHMQGSGFTMTAFQTHSYESEAQPDYIGILPLRIRESTTSFYRKGNRNYIRSVAWQKSATAGNVEHRSGTYIDREVPVKFISGPGGTGTGALLLPVSSSFFPVLSVLAGFMGFILGFAGLFLCMGMGFSFLLAVSRGQIFTDRNVRILHLIAGYLLGMGLLISIVRVVLYLAYLRQIPKELTLSYYHLVMDVWGYLVSGLIVLVIGKAFRNGMRIAEENELTV